MSDSSARKEKKKREALALALTKSAAKISKLKPKTDEELSATHHSAEGRIPKGNKNTSSLDTLKERPDEDEEEREEMEPGDDEEEYASDQVEENVNSTDPNSDKVDTSIGSETDSLVNFIKGITARMEKMDERLVRMESSRNLYAEEDEFSTPYKKKKSKGILESVAASTRRTNWKKDSSSNSTPPYDDDDPSDESSDSDTSSDLDSNSSKRKKSSKKGNGGKKRPPSKGDSNKLGSLFKSLDSSTIAASESIVTLTKNVNECKIRIDQFSLSNVARAIKKIIEYQERENTTVNMMKVLSISAQQHLRVARGITTEDIRTMNRGQLFNIMAEETRVHSVAHFYEELKGSLSPSKLLNWDTVTEIALEFLNITPSCS